MKPDWKDAPAWAKFLAQDFWGRWFWYEQQPSRDSKNKVWFIEEGRHIETSRIKNPNWERTLDVRPLEKVTRGKRGL